MAKYELTVTHHYKDNEKAPGAKELQNYVDGVLSASLQGWDAVSATLMVSDSKLKAAMYSGQVFNMKAKQDGEKHRQWPWRCSAEEEPTIEDTIDTIIAAEYDPKFGWNNIGEYNYDSDRKIFWDNQEIPVELKVGPNVWWRTVQEPDFVPPQNKPITNKNR
jgi:hypothetical protein